MKFKKVISMFLCTVLTITSVCLTERTSSAADSANPYLVKVAKDITSLGDYELVDSITSNSNNDESLKVSTNGSELTIEGKTALAPEGIGDSARYDASIFMIGNTSNSMYYFMKPTKSDGLYSFSGINDFASPITVVNEAGEIQERSEEPLPEGNYLINIFRTKSKINQYGNQMFYRGNLPIMYHNVIVKWDGTDAKIVQYQSILDANEQTYNAMKKYDKAPSFSDKSMKEMMYLLRTKAGGSTAALTSAQQKSVKGKADIITKGVTGTYGKARAIYKYVADRFIYDDKNASGKNAVTNPATLLASSTPVTNCVGFASTVAALSRAAGIKSRIIYGAHAENDIWKKKASAINTPSHHWAELQINGKWIMADANMGSGKHKKTDGTYTYKGSKTSNYTYFDCSKEQLAQNFIVKCVYKTENDISGPKLTLSNVVSTGKTKLSWGAVSGAANYTVYRAVKQYGTYTAIVTTTSKSYIDKITTAGNTYYYKVTPKITSGANKGLNASTVLKIGIPKLKQPTSVKGVGGAKKATISWKSVDYAKKYSVYRATSSNGKYAKVATVSTTKFVNKSLKKGKVYYYKVIALSGKTSKANSAFSKAVKVKIK